MRGLSIKMSLKMLSNIHMLNNKVVFEVIPDHLNKRTYKVIPSSLTIGLQIQNWWPFPARRRHK